MRTFFVPMMVVVILMTFASACRSKEKADETGKIVSYEYGLAYESLGLDGAAPESPVDLSAVTNGEIASVTLVSRDETTITVKFKCPDGTESGNVTVTIPPPPVPPNKTSQGPYVDTGCKKNGKPIRINVTRNR